VFLDQFLNSINFSPGESAASLKSHRFQPELCDLVVTLNVDVRWLSSITRIKEEPIRADLQKVGMLS
jgi:hypothetical protein